MKNTHWIAGFSAVLVCGWSALAAAEPAQREVTVRAVAGTLEIQPQGAAEWQKLPATQEMKIKQGDRVRTAPASSGQVQLEDGSQLALSALSELSVQTLQQSPAGQPQSIFGLHAGQLALTVSPQPEGSLFQVDTDVATARVPPSANPTRARLRIGSLDIFVGSGVVEIIRKGNNKLLVKLDQGQQALIEYDPATGNYTVTSLLGTFDVLGEDGQRITLAAGDSVSFSGGAATFIPAGTPVGDAPSPDDLDAFVEPPSPS